MRPTLTLLPVLCALLCASPGVRAQAPAASAAPVAKRAGAIADATAACERAAQQSLATRGAPAADLKFTAAAPDPAAVPGEHHIVLHGGGSWRAAGGPRRFAYSCNVDLRSPESVGLVLRDTTGGESPAAAATAAVEPDLRHLTPGACESSAAAAVKKRWPAALDIAFDSATRRLSQQSAARATLQGRGRALQAPGEPIVHFGFDCAIDPRDGRVLGISLSS